MVTETKNFVEEANRLLKKISDHTIPDGKGDYKSGCMAVSYEEYGQVLALNLGTSYSHTLGNQLVDELLKKMHMDRDLDNTPSYSGNRKYYSIPEKKEANRVLREYVIASMAVGDVNFAQTEDILKTREDILAVMEPLTEIENKRKKKKAPALKK